MYALTSLTLAALTAQAVADTCGLAGPGFPAPSSLASDALFKSIVRNITVGLDTATKSGKAFGLDLATNETSYSIGVFDAGSTLLSYQHTADAFALAKDSVKAVDGKLNDHATFHGVG